MEYRPANGLQCSRTPFHQNHGQLHLSSLHKLVRWILTKFIKQICNEIDTVKLVCATNT